MTWKCNFWLFNLPGYISSHLSRLRPPPKTFTCSNWSSNWFLTWSDLWILKKPREVNLPSVIVGVGTYCFTVWFRHILAPGYFSSSNLVPRHILANQNKGDVKYLFGSARILAPDVKTATFELDLIWGQVIITVFHEDSEYVISFAVPQTGWARVGREFLSHINMYIKWKLRSF